MKLIDCQEAERWVIEELDQGLTPERMQTLDDHCGRCSSCKDVRDQTKRLFSAIAADVPGDPGEEYWKYYHSSLEARLREKEAPRRWWLTWQAAAAALAAAVVVFAVTLETYDNSVTGGKAAHVSQAESTAVMEELYQLYGPVSEETATPATLREQVTALVGTNGVPDDAIIGWFEVEYEPNHVLL